MSVSSEYPALICPGYRLGAELGRGGSGRVLAATHEASNRSVAIKLLSPELSQSRQAVSRFFHEARLAGSIDDPGIVEVYEFGYTREGDAFLAMELLVGESLAKAITRGRHSLSFLRYVGTEIARTLEVAHARQVVHRDLKPENVFLAHAPERPFASQIKVLDFGMAKLNPEEGPYSFATDKNALVGTPMYMSPEQCRSAEVDLRSDIYALGCILYELACGHPPFFQGGLGLILGAHLYQPVRPPREQVPELPLALERLLLRCLAKAPAERPQSMREVAHELERIHG